MSGVPVPAGTSRTGLRGLTQEIPVREGRDGPAMRPIPLLAAELSFLEYHQRLIFSYDVSLQEEQESQKEKVWSHPFFKTLKKFL
jgi:transglutaminase-like putative cysteine protease